RKILFWAPFDSFFSDAAPSYVNQLLSRQALDRTGYFDATAVEHWRQSFRLLRRGSFVRSSVEMGLVGVFSTQLWHHLFIDGSLADVSAVHHSAPRTPAQPWAETPGVLG